MAGYFPETIASYLQGRRIRFAILVEFQFLSETVRVWSGFGQLITQDLRVWSGLGELGSVEGLSQPIGIVAPQATFRASGVSQEILSKAIQADPSEHFQRPVTVLLQFFTEEWQTLDLPYAVSQWSMDRPSVERTRGEDGEWVRSVTIPAESVFYGRARPAYGYWSDRDQQARFPGDRGCERMSELVFHTEGGLID